MCRERRRARDLLNYLKYKMIMLGCVSVALLK